MVATGDDLERALPKIPGPYDHPAAWGRFWPEVDWDTIETDAQDALSRPAEMHDAVD